MGEFKKFSLLNALNTVRRDGIFRYDIKYKQHYGLIARVNLISIISFSFMIIDKNWSIIFFENHELVQTLLSSSVCIQYVLHEQQTAYKCIHCQLVNSIPMYYIYV